MSRPVGAFLLFLGFRVCHWRRACEGYLDHSVARGPRNMQPKRSGSPQVVELTLTETRPGDRAIHRQGGRRVGRIISDEAREKGAATKRRRSALINTNGPATDRRQPGEVRKLSDAVQAFCRECCGFDPAGHGGMAGAVEDCRSPACHLYLYRDGKFHTDQAEAEVAGG